MLELHSLKRLKTMRHMNLVTTESENHPLVTSVDKSDTLQQAVEFLSIIVVKV